MKKILLVAIAAVAATIAGLNAQEGSFGQLLANPPQNIGGVPAASGPKAVNTAAPEAAAAPREWLVLVFINGVNDLGILGYAEKSINDMEKVGSTDKMAVVVEYSVMGQDGSASRNVKFQPGSKTLYITKDTDVSSITSRSFYSPKGTADMGSANSLVKFVRRGYAKYPAKKVAVVIWNHGAGRLGISYDDVSKNHMEVDQLGKALAQIKTVIGHNIDVFATDACLMQMAAVAYEFRNSADVIVGSEEVVPGESYPYDAFLGRMASYPAMGAEDVGRAMVETYGAYHVAGVTLSAVRSSAMGGFVGTLNHWLGSVAGDRKAFKVASDQALVDSVYKFPNTDSTADSRDLYDYVSNVNAGLGINSPNAKAAGQELQKYLVNNLLIKATKLPGMLSTHGLAIYIPALRYNSANYEKLAFAADSDWDDFLRMMMEERLKQP
ncbi:MAG TPA: clostripain-related cysteine peptidase [Elusimicrobiales bacterium]|nr:clostripain-related cysteine peptidase [Elusimicrobiales bacterium]